MMPVKVPYGIFFECPIDLNMNPIGQYNIKQYTQPEMGAVCVRGVVCKCVCVVCMCMVFCFPPCVFFSD